MYDRPPLVEHYIAVYVSLYVGRDVVRHVRLGAEPTPPSYQKPAKLTQWNRS